MSELFERGPSQTLEDVTASPFLPTQDDGGPAVSLPHRYEPRALQRPFWDFMLDGGKRAACVWHRKFGKSLVAWNWIILAAFLKPGLYWHAFPSYAQGKKTVWDGMSSEGRPFLDYIPQELIVRKLDNELAVWIRTAVPGTYSKIQIVGADNVDSLRGPNPLGVVFDEWSETDPEAWDVISPVLVVNGGWAVFIFTPKGRNHSWRMFDRAGRESDWFTQLLTIDDTGVVSQEQIEKERRDGRPEELIQQEYYCSFSSALVGSIYGDQLLLAERATPPRITKVAHDSMKPVITSWDLGVSDATSIWFAQQFGSEIRFIDFEEGISKDIAHYAKKLNERVSYVYDVALLPHDAAQRSMTGRTCVEMLQQLGFRTRMVPRVSVQDGIQAVRGMFPRFWFDKDKCENGLQMLREYSKKYDQDRREYSDTPAHGYASHAADALRYYAVGMREERRWHGPIGPKVATV